MNRFLQAAEVKEKIEQCTWPACLSPIYLPQPHTGIRNFIANDCTSLVLDQVLVPITRRLDCSQETEIWKATASLKSKSDCQEGKLVAFREQIRNLKSKSDPNLQLSRLQPLPKSEVTRYNAEDLHGMFSHSEPTLIPVRVDNFLPSKTSADLIMAWTKDTIIAIITLLATCTPIFIVIINLVIRERRRWLMRRNSKFWERSDCIVEIEWYSYCVQTKRLRIVLIKISPTCTETHLQDVSSSQCSSRRERCISQISVYNSSLVILESCEGRLAAGDLDQQFATWCGDFSNVKGIVGRMVAMAECVSVLRSVERYTYQDK